MKCAHPLINILYKPPGHSKAESLGIIGKIQGNDLEKYSAINESNRNKTSDLHYFDYGWNRTIFPKYLNYTEIPCGQCRICRINNSKMWATRCVLESKMWEENWFITLTYDEEHLPRRDEEYIDPKGRSWFDDGSWNGYLVPEDLQKFNKDMREYWRTHFNHIGVRFFAVGEYGSKNLRPHYHGIYFNLPIKPNDLKFLKTTNDGNILYTCPILEKIWGKGFITVAHTNWNTAAYVARYCTKKMTGELGDIHYGLLGQIPEFQRMSNRPGIARAWYEKHKNEIYKLDEIIMKTTKEKTVSLRPPTYYDKLYDIDNHDDMQMIKDRRRILAEQREKVKDSKTSLTRLQQRELEERDFIQRTNRLIREL